MTKDITHIPVDIIANFMKDTFQALGVPKEEAAICADVLIASNEGIGAAAQTLRAGHDGVVMVPNGIGREIHNRLQAAAVASDGAELLGDPHRLLHALELLEALDRDHAGRAQQVDLGERAGSPLDLVQLRSHTGVALGELHHAPHLGGVGLNVRLHDDDHGKSLQPPNSA